MPSSFSKSAICLFVLSTGLLLNFAIPPFQNPDEPQHLKIILIHALGQEKAAAAEKDIIEFMDRCNWWRFVGLGRPEILPTELTQTDFIGSNSRRMTSTFSVEFYHMVEGKLAGMFAKKKVETIYYICRFSSLLCCAGAVLLFFSAFSSIARFSQGPLVLGAFFILLLPQLSVSSIAVNPDAFSLLFTSLFFYAAVQFIIEGFRIHYMILLFFSAAVCFFYDKAAVTLIPLAFLLPILNAKKENWKGNLARFILFSWMAVLLLAWAAWYLPAPFYNSLDTIGRRIWINIPAALGFSASGEFACLFFSLLADSFLLRFGWMGYSAETVFYVTHKILLLLSFLGILIYFGKSISFQLKKGGSRIFHSNFLKLILFFLMALCLQLLLIWIAWSPRRILAQGRYLFPVLLPITGLFVTGLLTLFSSVNKKAGKAIVSVLVVGAFLFLNFVIWNWILPVFHLTQTSPFPGS